MDESFAKRKAAEGIPAKWTAMDEDAEEQKAGEENPARIIRIHINNQVSVQDFFKIT